MSEKKDLKQEELKNVSGGIYGRQVDIDQNSITSPVTSPSPENPNNNVFDAIYGSDGLCPDGPVVE